MVAGHFRLRPRYPLRVRVSLRRQAELASREVEGLTENLGFGGAFVLADPPLPPGTRVLVFISSATTWEPLRLGATVRWVRDGGERGLAGMGIEFEPLIAEHAIALQQLFVAHGFEED